MNTDQTPKKDQPETATEAEAAPPRHASDRNESEPRDTETRPQYDSFMRVIRR